MIKIKTTMSSETNYKRIKARIVGSDYTKISESSLEFFDEEKNAWIADCAYNKEEFIKSALIKISENGKLGKNENLVVNYRKDNRSTSDKHIWKMYGKDGIRYDGIVGVLKFELKKSEIEEYSRIRIINGDENDGDEGINTEGAGDSNADKVENNEKINNDSVNYYKTEIDDKLNSDIVFDVTLQIKSRFDTEVNKPYFLSTMLLCNEFELNNNTVPSNEESLYDILLLFLFKKYFSRAVQKGLFRKYIRFERNDDRLRGSIDIARHIKYNAGQRNGRIAYSYRENTVDNLLNCLIARAYEHLKMKYFDLVSDNFDNDIDLKQSIDSIKRQLTSLNKSNTYLLSKNIKPIAHPYYLEYEELRKVCIKILRDEGITFFDGDTDDEINGVLFYIPDLWEMYLEKKLGGNLDRESNIELSTQDSTGNNVVNVFGCKGQNEYKYKQTTRPDFIFKTQGESFMILDAKFKPAWYEAMYRGKLGEQLLLDFDKCIRDMVGSGCYATGVIFPTNNEYGEIKEHEVMNYNSITNYLKHTISKDAEDKMFYTISVNVPRVEETEYEKWAKKFNNSIDILKNQVLTILNKEKEIYLEVKEKKEELSNRIKTLREN